MNPIIVIDSGVGGLTIFDAIRKKLPEWPLIYCFDNAAFPYGNKHAEVVTQRVQLCLQQLCNYCTPALIVVACNTASTVVLPALRNQFTIPVVGVVPAIKPAAKVSEKRCIGLLATSATIGRSYTAKLIKSYAQHCKVISLGSDELVKLAEDKMHGQPVSVNRLKSILLPFTTADTIPDCIVLGCTHFPILKEELIKSTHPLGIKWIDSGNAIAQRVDALLSETQRPHRQEVKHQAFYTRKHTFSKAFEHFFIQQRLNSPQLLFL